MFVAPKQPLSGVLKNDDQGSKDIMYEVHPCSPRKLTSQAQRKISLDHFSSINSSTFSNKDKPYIRPGPISNEEICDFSEYGKNSQTYHFSDAF